jgi:hypothetical protein
MLSSAVSKRLAQLSGNKVDLARSYCLVVARSYWKFIRQKTGVSWHIRRYSGVEIDLPPDLRKEACGDALRMSRMAPDDAGYHLSIQYMNLLPTSYRSQHGEYVRFQQRLCENVNLATIAGAAAQARLPHRHRDLSGLRRGAADYCLYPRPRGDQKDSSLGP